MEILIRWFALVFVQIIYFNIKIKKIDVVEIKPCANLHKVSNIKHVILGTIYFYKKNRNIIYSQQMQSKSWLLCLLAVSPRREYCEFCIAIIC